MNPHNQSAANGSNVAFREAVTFNPLDKHASVDLSAGNLRATTAANGQYLPVRLTHGRLTGKRYVEFLITSPGFDLLLEITDFSANMTLPVSPSSAGSGGVAWSKNGLVSQNWGAGELASGGGASAPTLASGQYARMAIDFGAKAFWLAADGGDWEGGVSPDPENGTGGYTAWPAGAGPFVLCASLWRSSGGVLTPDLTVNCGASPFAFSPPPGFEPYNLP